ncbi:MAG: DMT family transporter [Nitrososphaerales archaeon]|jgi:drug/metabolite transporter (DMT)-like permease
MNKQTKDWILLSIILITWGLNYPVVKFGLEYSAPLAFSFYRVLIAAVVSVPLAVHSIRSKKPSKSLRSKKVLFAMALFSLTSTVIFLGFWYIAETLVDPGITAVIIYTYPLFTVLFSKLFLSDHLSPLKIIGIITGFIGAIILLTNGNISHTSINPFGFALLFVASVSFATSFIVYRKWLMGLERISINTLQLLFSTLLLFLWTLLSNPVSLYSIHFTNPVFIASLIFTGIFGTAVAYLIWMTLLESRGVVWLSSLSFLVPVIALFSSAVLLGEQIDLIQLAGFAVIVFGIAAVNRK